MTEVSSSFTRLNFAPSFLLKIETEYFPFSVCLTSQYCWPHSTTKNTCKYTVSNDKINIKNRFYNKHFSLLIIHPIWKVIFLLQNLLDYHREKWTKNFKKKVFAIIAAARIIISISSTIVSSALNSPKIKEKFAYSFIFNPAEQKLSLLKKKEKKLPLLKEKWEKNVK